MKLFTLIFATTCLLSISTVSFAQTSFISIKYAETSQKSVDPSTAGSIKFNLLGIADGIIKVKMYNQLSGIYTVQLMNADGKMLASNEVSHNDNTNVEVVDFGKKFEGGSYQVVVVNPDNNKTVQTIMLLM
jgi:hypothetical protein